MFPLSHSLRPAGVRNLKWGPGRAKNGLDTRIWASPKTFVSLKRRPVIIKNDSLIVLSSSHSPLLFCSSSTRAEASLQSNDTVQAGEPDSVTMLKSNINNTNQCSVTDLLISVFLLF